MTGDRDAPSPNAGAGIESNTSEVNIYDLRAALMGLAVLERIHEDDQDALNALIGDMDSTELIIAQTALAKFLVTWMSETTSDDIDQTIRACRGHIASALRARETAGETF